jgi:hypothetical protein
MKQRGELMDAGGLDKIAVHVIKVMNDAKTVKYESLDYLTKLQRDGLSLNLDATAIAKQILNETVKIMTVVHPRSTYEYFADLLDLKVSSSATQEEFRMFVTPDEAKKQQDDSTKGGKRRPCVMNDTLFNHFTTTALPAARKRKLDVDEEKKTDPPGKKLKQSTLTFD